MIWTVWLSNRLRHAINRTAPSRERAFQCWSQLTSQRGSETSDVVPPVVFVIHLGIITST